MTLSKVLYQTQKENLLIAEKDGIVCGCLYYLIESSAKIRLKKRGDTDEEARKTQTHFEKEVSLINANKTYSDYKKNGGAEKLSDNRYEFIRKNINEDVTKTLSNVDKPLLLVLADKDENVDSNETERVYSEEVDSRFLTVKRIPNVEHQMINPMIANSDILINIVGFMLPKYFLIDQTYLNECSKFISQF